MPEQNNSGAGYNPTLAGIGGSIGGSLVGGAMTMLGNYIQQKYYEKNLQQQYNYNERAAKNADRRTRALFNDLYSPGAQKQMYVDAGFSPSIMYSQGMQGVSGSTPHGAQGAGANMQMPGMAPLHLDSQFALTAAQIELMKSEARKNNADADTKEGKNPLGEATIQSLLASAGLADVQKQYQEIQNYVTNEAKDFSVSYLEHMARHMEYLADEQFWNKNIKYSDWQFSVDTYDDRVKTISASLENVIQDTNTKAAAEAFYNSEIKVNDAQIKQINAEIVKIYNDIAQGWKSLAIQERGQLMDYKVRKEANRIQKKAVDNAMKNFRDKLEQDLDIADADRKQKYITNLVEGISALLKSGSSILGALLVSGAL